MARENCDRSVLPKHNEERMPDLDQESMSDAHLPGCGRLGGSGSTSRSNHVAGGELRNQKICTDMRREER